MKYLILFLFPVLLTGCSENPVEPLIPPQANDNWFLLFQSDTVYMTLQNNTSTEKIDFSRANSAKFTCDYITNDDSLMHSFGIIYVYKYGSNYYLNLSSKLIKDHQGTISVVTDTIPMNFRTEVYYYFSNYFSKEGKFLKLTNLKVFIK